MIDPLFWSGRRVFVTGHTGFKGGWIATWLLRMGAQITGYSLAPETEPAYFDLCGLGNRMPSLIGDIRDLQNLSASIRDSLPEVVFHLAAQSVVRRSYADPLGTLATNVMGTAHVLESARQTLSVKAVIIVTSDKCYENNESGARYREDAPLGGRDPYSSSKACAELVTRSYRESFFQDLSGRVGVATVRAGNVIGGGDWSEDRLVPDAIRAYKNRQPLVIRNPDAVRPWQHVLDPLAGYLMLAQRLFEKGPEWAGAWNFGPSDEAAVSVASLVERLAATLGISWKIEENGEIHEAQQLRLDSTKARSLLGWQPQFRLDDALEMTAAWYQAALSGSSADRLFNLSVQQIERHQTHLSSQ